jgi:hypothetical protein
MASDSIASGISTVKNAAKIFLQIWSEGRSSGAGTLRCCMLHVQATIVKMQLSRIARAPRLEGFGCHGTSRSESPSFAESPAAAKNAKNKYNTNNFRAEEPDPDIWKMPCAILPRQLTDAFKKLGHSLLKWRVNS